MIYSAQGILVHRLPFSNTSLILSWLTPETGLIKTMAKGALRPKSPFAGSIDLFYRCDLRYTLRSGQGMGTLRELRLDHPFLALRRDWRVILCAQYFADLFMALTEPQAEVADFYTVFTQALVYLETHLPSERLISRYERRLLHLSGLPTEIPEALLHGLSTHHHTVPSTRQRLLQSLSSP